MNPAETGERLSVTILTKNEAAIIARCIASVRWADEVIVLDSGSTDDTRSIAEAAGATVHEQSWLGWVPQHQRAIDLAVHDWVLVMDADELVTPQLAESILELLASNPDPRDGFAVDRQDELFGRMLPNMRRKSRRMAFIRLFNRRHSHYDPAAPIHEMIISPGATHMLRGGLLHWRNVRFLDQCHKDVDNAAIEAGVLEASGVKVRQYHLVMRPLLRFLWCYVLCRGFRAGGAGLMNAIMRAQSEYYRYAALWERQNAPPAPNPPSSLWDASRMPE